nr:uncharacterized protein LOC119188021 [Rhipicephalus microplus]
MAEEKIPVPSALSPTAQPESITDFALELPDELLDISFVEPDEPEPTPAEDPEPSSKPKKPRKKKKQEQTCHPCATFEPWSGPEDHRAVQQCGIQGRRETMDDTRT